MMNDRKSKKSVFLKIGAVFGLALAVLVGVSVFRSQAGGGREPLPVSDYRDAPRNFAGNEYALDARIDELLGFREGVGRVLLVREVESGSPLALFVGAETTGFSPSPGQAYRFEVTVGGDGLLGMRKFRKL